jgi:hypothetical protein
MIAVRLEDGSMVYGFGRAGVVAKNPLGQPDRYWEELAERNVEACGDLWRGLATLPGATVVLSGSADPTLAVEPSPMIPQLEDRSTGRARRSGGTSRAPQDRGGKDKPAASGRGRRRS